MPLTQTQIKNGWKVVKMGEVLEPAKTTIKKGDVYDSVPMELISSGKKFPERFEQKTFSGSGTRFSNGDTLFARITPCLQNRKIVQVKNLKNGVGFGSTEYFIFRAKENVSNKDYIYYLATSDEIVKPAIKSMVGASGRQRVNESVVRDIKIKFPPLPTQEKIANVLSAYDDLIENNDKRIKVLEAMAQKLYTEWFVNFKFPGHESVKMVDSGHPDFGMMPEGWEVRSLSEIGKVITGKTPSTTNKKFFNGEILFIKTPDIHGNIFIINSDQTLSDLGADSQKSKTLPEKTIFVSCIGTLGSVGITSKLSQTNQQINAVLLNNVEDYIFLYFFLGSSKKQLINLGSNGATMGNVNKDKFEKIELLVPERTVLNIYNKNVSPHFEQILNLQKQNQNLKKSRDFLIPQLVGGRVEVK